MIRGANIGDMPELYRLASLLNPPWTENSLAAVLENNNADIYVYVSDIIRGFICLEYILEEGCITAVATDGSYRGRGIARQLITYGERQRNKTNIYLEVEETNIQAIKLYESCGYKATGKRKNYYGKNAAIIMNKEF